MQSFFSILFIETEVWKQFINDGFQENVNVSVGVWASELSFNDKIFHLNVH